ncbi:MAG: hypothetical protein ACRD8K_01745 [Nitrososphaeraceae archaeon]
MVKDSNFQLSLRSQFTQLSPSTKIARWKDDRLKLVNISKGLIEALQDAGFTIEKILEWAFQYCRKTRNRSICGSNYI